MSQARLLCDVRALDTWEIITHELLLYRGGSLLHDPQKGQKVALINFPSSSESGRAAK